MKLDWYEIFASTNWMEWAKVIADLIKGIAWPVAATFIVFIFRKQIRDRIKDIVSLGPTGAVLQPSNQQLQSKPTTGLQKTATHPLPTVQALITKIEGELGNVADEERIPKLIYTLAEAQIERSYEVVWGAIFGSQILAMRRMLEGTFTMEEARALYDNDVRPHIKDPDKYSFYDWCNFLLRQNLVSSAENGQLLITEYGRDFISFIDIRKRELSKAL
ncbi:MULTISPECIES: hypothetical protein [unclassified Rhizobium]|uniref:hypothetical protein n=1 Tax=unclassified Rhizobium TaxID=2613769 RepID=UPI0024795CD3|nr:MULTISPECIES: hypothetical protein [unclassified Rhizobium]MDH7803783.1 hypothetical protein [Rhizobium sp. AN70]